MFVGVLLSGSGVYDGSEIHEAAFTLLAIDQNGGQALCMAPNIEQHHVINHIDGGEMDEKRNVLIESARIARGNIQAIEKVKMDLLDGLVICGGFGAAKNLTTWNEGAEEAYIDPDIKRLVIDFVSTDKPVLALCMGPTVIATAFKGIGLSVKLTVGTTEEDSAYDIEEISDAMKSAGAEVEMKTIREICIDDENRVISAPCYMMDASPEEVYDNIKMGVAKMFEWIDENHKSD
jgi:enhancing lycopene biosynthesis protein 2